MDFGYSPRTQELQARLSAFMAEHVYPAEAAWFEEIEAHTRAGPRPPTVRVRARLIDTRCRSPVEVALELASCA